MERKEGEGRLCFRITVYTKNHSALMAYAAELGVIALRMPPENVTVVIERQDLCTEKMQP